MKLWAPVTLVHGEPKSGKTTMLRDMREEETGWLCRVIRIKFKVWQERDALLEATKTTGLTNQDDKRTRGASFLARVLLSILASGLSHLVLPFEFNFIRSFI
jgi:hypothetical protein